MRPVLEGGKLRVAWSLDVKEKPRGKEGKDMGRFFGGNRWMDNLGMLLLSIWLILEGAIPLLKLSVSGLDLAMNILAIAAGVLLLMKR
jgi:hypothetical protein